MATWVKMSVTVLVALLPGGFVFLFAWAIWRAWSARVRLAKAAAQPGGGPTGFQVLATLEVRDLWREARQFSGLVPAGPGR
jgi:hypothetical protein